MEETDPKSVSEEIEREVIDFQNKLHQLVSQNPITKDCVRILSLPPLPLEFSHLKEVGLKVLERDIPKPIVVVDKKSFWRIFRWLEW